MYQAGINKFVHFCNIYHVSNPLPVSLVVCEHHAWLSLLVSALFANLASCVSISSFHRLSDFHCTFEVHLGRVSDTEFWAHRFRK